MVLFLNASHRFDYLRTNCQPPYVLHNTVQALRIIIGFWMPFWNAFRAYLFGIPLWDAFLECLSGTMPQKPFWGIVVGMLAGLPSLGSSIGMASGGASGIAIWNGFWIYWFNAKSEFWKITILWPILSEGLQQGQCYLRRTTARVLLFAGDEDL